MRENIDIVNADATGLVPMTGMPECPVCASQFAEYMGALGKRVHFRCNACGSDYSEPTGEG